MFYGASGLSQNRDRVLCSAKLVRADRILRIPTNRTTTDYTTTVRSEVVLGPRTKGSIFTRLKKKGFLKFSYSFFLDCIKTDSTTAEFVVVACVWLVEKLD
jgi:hypothetical protein